MELALQVKAQLKWQLETLAGLPALFAGWLVFCITMRCNRAVLPHSNIMQFYRSVLACSISTLREIYCSAEQI